MFRNHTRPVAWALTVAGLLLADSGFARAASELYVGAWKVTVHLPPGSQTLWLIQAEQKDNQPDAKVTSAAVPALKDAKVESFTADDKSLHFTITTPVGEFRFAMYAPAADVKHDKLVGSVGLQGQRFMAELVRTKLTKIDPANFRTPSPGLEELKKASQMKDAGEREAAFTKFLEKYPEGTLAYAVRLDMLAAAAKNASAETDLRASADKLIAAATPYGPEMKRHALQTLTQIFLSSDKLKPLVLDYAQQTEKTIDKFTPPAEQAFILKLMASALKKNGKENEAKELKPRLARLDTELDEEFAKNAVPFKPEPARPRTASDGRVALVELFTGAMCPPCVAADVAFDALLLSHKANDVVVLQFHEHIPGPDPLTNKDSESRFEFYGLGSTPSFVIDGKKGPAVGGPKQAGKESYEAIIKALDSSLENKPEALLKASAVKSAGKINIHAEVAGLKKPGESVRLRLVLVEELVHFAGSNGQRLHHHVVRGFPGGVEGLALKQAAGKHDVSVNIADLRKSLNDYLVTHKFDDESRPLDLKHLKVVAFVQDDATKEVLQAAQVDIRESKSETN